MKNKVRWAIVVVVVAAIITLSNIVLAGAVEQAIKIVINGKAIQAESGPILMEGQLFVPIRLVAEELGAQVKWDDEKRVVTIQSGGDFYLKGKSNPNSDLGIINNLIKASELRDLLDDDRDGELADYRQGKSGGDHISNDPVVVDIRKESEYKKFHIPGAVWVANAEEMAENKSIDKVKALLRQHIAQGGKNEIVLYCYTGNTSGLSAGVLGAQGLPVKSLMYGFDIGWRGTKQPDPAVKANMENSAGNALGCGG